MQRTPAAVDTYVGEEGFFIEEPPDSVGPGDNVIADFQRANLLLRDERGARGRKYLVNCFNIIFNSLTMSNFYPFPLDWNDEFQTLSVAHPTGSVDAEMLRVAKLRKLCIGNGACLPIGRLLRLLLLLCVSLCVYININSCYCIFRFCGGGTASC